MQSRERGAGWDRVELEGKQVRETEFWTRMEAALGPEYARPWAKQQVLAGLGERTVEQALADGWDPKVIWREVHKALELPPRDR
jgi:hypothetical protein